MLSVGTAQADIYKCVDPGGHVTYTNQKTDRQGLRAAVQGPGRCPRFRRRSRPPRRRHLRPRAFPRSTATPRRSATATGARSWNRNWRRSRRTWSRRRRSWPSRKRCAPGDEKNYQRVLDRLQPYKDKVALHERNVEALQEGNRQSRSNARGIRPLRGLLLAAAVRHATPPSNHPSYRHLSPDSICFRPPSSCSMMHCVIRYVESGGGESVRGQQQAARWAGRSAKLAGRAART